MKVYMLTDEDMKGLLDQLELTAMREANITHADVSRPEIADLHRAFHFVAVRWTQAHGYSGGRS